MQRKIEIVVVFILLIMMFVFTLLFGGSMLTPVYGAR